MLYVFNNMLYILARGTQKNNNVQLGFNVASFVIYILLFSAWVLKINCILFDFDLFITILTYLESLSGFSYGMLDLFIPFTLNEQLNKNMTENIYNFYKTK